MDKKRLVIGVLAHVDSGKTTLSEGLLYRAGAIRKLGRVDHQDAFLDTYALERARGITIFAKQAVLALPNTELTLLDTPGHVDFSAEMERTLQVLDYAVLVVSGTDGVQSHTETLWRLLERCHLPVFVFVNKMDLAAPRPEMRAARLAELNRRFGAGFVDFGADIPEPDRQEAMALCDEPLMEQFLQSGALPAADIAAAVARRKVFPCWFGSALKIEGIDGLLDGLDRFTRTPARHTAFGARVFKIAQDEQGKRLSYMKITGGALAVKAPLTGRDCAGEWTEKADQLRVYSGSKYQAVPEVLPGMVCAVTGLTRTFAGQGLGAEPDAAAPVLEPVLTYRVALPPDSGVDAHTALSQLRVLEQEDPQLHVVWNETLGEIHLQLMGEIQLEILKSLLKERFGLEAAFSQGSILYKETVTRAGEGIGHYEPLRHYAEVHLLLEPGERGSGLRFAADCREEVLDKNWQRLVLTHLAEKPLRGVLTGAPLTDVKITLVAGRAHIKHTEGGDFRQATYRAVRQGLRSLQAQGGVELLEPFYTFRLEVPTENLGRAMTDLQQLGADFDPPETGEEMTLLVGRAPVAALRDYPAQVTAYTRGRGRLACMPAGYAPCHNAAEVIDAAGYDPEHDTDDPADSVFCAHGAGYTVKWDEVRKYCHVESAYGKPLAASEADAAAPRPGGGTGTRRAAYHGTLAEDKELLAIFERTYGPIKSQGAGPDRRRAFRPAPAGNAPPVPLPDGPEYLLVDGYNVIYSWDELNALAAENLDGARRRLCDILCNYRGYCKGEVIVVFDAYKVKGNPGSVEPYHNISVVYTKEAETADMYIEKVTHQIGRRHRVRVVSSDGLEQLIILGNGGLRVSARAFRQEMDAVEKSIREYLSE